MTGSPLADHTGLRLTFALIWVVEYAPYEIGRGGGGWEDAQSRLHNRTDAAC